MQGVTASQEVGRTLLDLPPSPNDPGNSKSIQGPSDAMDAPKWSAAVFVAFYRAFVARNFDRMESFYHPDVKFKDMVFEYGDRAGTMKMWRKILADPTTQIRFDIDKVEGDTVKGHWIADYKVFGRPVHNELTTEMVIKDGKIVSHTDHSDWDKWAPQAFPLGHLATLPGVKQLAIGLIRMSID